ncbi:MAG: hypothetical protein QOC72_960 [Methylobacteriaceae bacterium]|jgi:hypothetical protein|nr:hypothetical protein [Methylobacteriaceae bacterium]
MSATGGLKTIVDMLETITSNGDLKTVAREVQRRGIRLQAELATAFRQGDEVSWVSRGRGMPGIVQRVEGGRVLVKLAHGFVARVSPSDLRRASKPAARIV